MNIFDKFPLNPHSCISFLPLRLEYKDKKFYSRLSVSDYSLGYLSGKLNKYLSKQEKEDFETLNCNSRRSSYLLGRAITKYSLMDLLGISSMKDISIVWGVFGQPVINCKVASNLQVSISHNDNYAVSLVFDEKCPMAIDIERVDSTRARSVRSQLTELEIRTFVKSDIDLIVLWTAKESLSKLLKTGLMTDFALYEIDKLSKRDGHIEICFKNFSQYKVLSYFFSDTICSVILPNDAKLHHGEFNYISDIK